jgi:hypothetical protein
LLLETFEGVRVVADLWHGERLDRRVPRHALQIEWAGGGALLARPHWLRLKGGGSELMVRADVGMNFQAMRDATADLFRTLSPGRPLPDQAKRGFALEENRATAIASGVLLALLVLVGVDAMANDHELLSETPFFILPLVGELTVLPLLGALLALPLYPVLRWQRAPRAESGGLTCLMIVAMALAAVPVAKRLDQMLAPAARAVAYRLVGGSSLVPVQPGPPSVQFPELKQYWAQFEPGSEHLLMLVHGPLGLWQLDRAPLHEKTRAYYGEHPEAPRQAAASTRSSSADGPLVMPSAAARPPADHPASTAPTPTR